MTSSEPSPGAAASPFRSLVLDLDGTLIDSLPGIEGSVLEAISSCGIRPVISDFRSLVGPRIREIMEIATGGVDPDTLERLVAAFRRIYDGGGWRNSLLYPGVVETLRQLSAAGLQMIVLTNKPHRPACDVIAHLGFANYIDAVYGPDSHQPPLKGKTEAAGVICAQRKLHPAQTLFVGDSSDDAAAAFGCGSPFAAVEYGYGNAASQKEFPVHYRLRQFGDILAVLAGAPSS